MYTGWKFKKKKVILKYGRLKNRILTLSSCILKMQIEDTGLLQIYGSFNLEEKYLSHSIQSGFWKKIEEFYNDPKQKNLGIVAWRGKPLF